MERDTRIQLVVLIILGLLTALIIVIVWWAEPITDTPRHPKHEIDIRVEISGEEQAILIEVKQPTLNFGNYTILVGSDLSDKANSTIFKNLTQIGFKGDIVSFTSPSFNPLKGDTIEVALYFHEDEDGGGVRIWRKDIKVS